jgi:predicted esterase
MPSWYDIYSFPKDNWFAPGRKEDRTGMLRSRDSIAALVQEQVAAGTPENRIVVGGFSQGAAVTMLVGFTAPPKLAGIAIASGYMPLWQEIKDLANGHAAELPIWWSHGTQDPLIPLQAAEHSLSIARAKLGISNVEPGSNVGIQWQTFPIPHSASEAEIVSLGQWLAHVLPQTE